MEPGAPWQIEPDKYGIVTSRKTFADFLKVHSQRKAGTYTNLGYYIPDYFKKPLDTKDREADFAKKLQKLKCKHFCFIHPDGRKTSSPFWGRMLCRAMQLMGFITMKDRKYNAHRRINSKKKNCGIHCHWFSINNQEGVDIDLLDFFKSQGKPSQFDQPIGETAHIHGF